MQGSEHTDAEGQSLKGVMAQLSFGPALLLQLGLCTLVMLIDGYDLSAMPLAVPHVLRVWGIEASSFSIALSAVLVGLGGGALFLAPLGDRFGRRPLIISSTLAIALATLGTAFAGSTMAFAVWRLLTGLALGACLPNVTALVSEIAPRHRRAGLLVLVSCGVSVGAIGAGLLVPMLVAMGGWQMIFTASAVLTLAVSAALYWALPESPAFLFGQGQFKALNALFARYGLRVDASTLRADGHAADAGRSASLLAPFARPYLLATFVFAGLYTVNALTLYMLVSWLPTLLPSVGFTVDEASRLVSLVQLGGLMGGLLLSWLLDRALTVAAFSGGYLLVIAGLVAVPYLPASAVAWGPVLLLLGAGVSGAHLAIMAVGTGFYPAGILSAAIGVAVAVARLGAIAGPMLGGFLIAEGYGIGHFMLALIVPVALCLCLVWLIPAAQKDRAA